METATDIWEKQKEIIPGGVMSINRVIDPMRVFVRAKGAYMWDHEGNRFIDYHAAFSPYLLGHGNEDVDGAVIDMIGSGASLMGGRFFIGMTVIGVLIIQALTTGILLSGLPSQYTLIVKAAVVMVVLLVQAPKSRELVGQAMERMKRGKSDENQ